MNKRDTEECLKRAKECARQVDAAVDPELKVYLIKLALSWSRRQERRSNASCGPGPAGRPSQNRLPARYRDSCA